MTSAYFQVLLVKRTFGMNQQKIRFPYGRSNYASLIKRGYHYVDKTRYIKWLEETDESYVFFLRPRRFGKSLFASVLQHYYGLEFKEEFELLFGKFYIGQHPTPEKNAYHVLKFNFSGIQTSTQEKTEAGFLAKVRSGIIAFLRTYSLLSVKEKDYILQQSDAALTLNTFFDAILGNVKIYLLIDEYDHFTNALMAADFVTFQDAVSQDGFVRTFYETIKNGTDEGIIERIFITGVSPITLDSLTSGFNIGTHFSLEEALHEMMGFSEKEVLSMLEQIAPAEKQAAILADMSKWYNGYLFNEDAKQKIYNSDMVLYFLKHYKRYGKYPKEMLDTNISSDYGKLRRMFNLKTPIKNYEILKEIVEGKEQKANIVTEFSLRKNFTKNDFLSLLFYLGFLTIQSAKGGSVTLKIPNYVIQRLYFDSFIAQLIEGEEMPSQFDQIQESMLEMAFQGNPEPFFQLIEKVLSHLSRRDYRGFDEKHIKAIIIALATQVETYFVKSEREHQSGYSDVLFLERPPFNIDHQYIFELKYLKQAEKKGLPTVQKKAKKQLLDYISGEPELQSMKNLQAWIVIVMKDKIFRERVD